jgi:hypothetical protein
VLDGIEHVRKAARRFRRGDLRHKVRLSEMIRRDNTTYPERQLCAGAPGKDTLHSIEPFRVGQTFTGWVVQAQLVGEPTRCVLVLGRRSMRCQLGGGSSHLLRWLPSDSIGRLVA